MLVTVISQDKNLLLIFQAMVPALGGHRRISDLQLLQATVLPELKLSHAGHLKLKHSKRSDH